MFLNVTSEGSQSSLLWKITQRRSRNVVFTLKDSRVAFTGFRMDNQRIEWQQRAEELILKVPASVSAGEMISLVMAQYPVEDVRIEETPIEDIIEEIYNQ